MYILHFFFLLLGKYYLVDAGYPLRKGYLPLPAFSRRGKPTNHNLINFFLYAFFFNEYFYMLFDELEKLFLYIDFY